MLSYQHSYHAGNHADLLKHVVLLDLLAALQEKESPIFVLDAFAGRGIYDLDSDQARKNREFDTGIGRLWQLPAGARPAAVQRLLEIVAARNPGKEISRYPGSAAITDSRLREQDRQAACEMHPQEFALLKRNLAGSSRTALHRRDAYEALKALLPPRQGRGLVFLDPSYEIKDEYRRIARAVAVAYPHFRAGVYAIWYPLLPAAGHLEMFRELRDSGIRKIMRVEMSAAGSFVDMQMQGSGLLIINPPWQAQQSIRESLHWICPALAGDMGEPRCSWLVPE